MVPGNKKTSTTKTTAKVGTLKLNKETSQWLSASEQKKIRGGARGLSGARGGLGQSDGAASCAVRVS
jgi:hypothetical protein